MPAGFSYACRETGGEWGKNEARKPRKFASRQVSSALSLPVYRATTTLGGKDRVGRW